MQNGPLMGFGDLRKTIFRYLERDELTCRPGYLLITNGAKHGLDLSSRVQTQPGDRTIETAPTNMVAIQILRNPVLAYFRRLWMQKGCARTGSSCRGCTGTANP